MHLSAPLMGLMAAFAYAAPAPIPLAVAKPEANDLAVQPYGSIIVNRAAPEPRQGQCDVGYCVGKMQSCTRGICGQMGGAAW